MALKKFNDYLVSFSKDKATFEKKVAVASLQTECNLFKIIKEDSELLSNMSDIPVVIWNSFKYTPSTINENKVSFYNVTSVPELEDVFDLFENESFIPKSLSDRKSVKSLKFPIVGINNSKTEVFKTYHKFKKSKNMFNKFRQKPTAISRFDALVFNRKPIHIQEKINNIGFDSELNSFAFLNEFEEIIEKVCNKLTSDLFSITLVKAKDDNIYLESISQSGKLTPTQRVKIYESVYEYHYNRRLPVWFKKQLFENNVKGSYRTMYHNSLLLKPKYSLDFKKYLK